ncbi:MAG: polysaccharide deacetylase family protein [Alphaproteobacteria bacterium]|nr:MAG: polysaccharide deacetylase family protein [Alphaproteobacteria bacterium]
MFHHFHGKDHYQSQGSITRDTLVSIIKTVKDESKLISSDVFLDKCLTGQLKKDEVCLTFDDALLCQYDIALPVLEDMGLKAFWFINSQSVKNQKGNLELYRYFRSKYFISIDQFYEAFNAKIESTGIDIFKHIDDFTNTKYLKEYSFYSESDRLFRYFRDVVLGKNKYFSIMDSILDCYGVKKSEIASKIWLSKKNIKEINKLGHIIGAHSYSHPTNLKCLSLKEQCEEYRKNILDLKKIIHGEVLSMAHPCNSYSDDTMSILEDLNIKIGFRSNATLADFSNFELPRIDHVNVLKGIK